MRNGHHPGESQASAAHRQPGVSKENEIDARTLARQIEEDAREIFGSSAQTLPSTKQPAWKRLLPWALTGLVVGLVLFAFAAWVRMRG